MEPIFNFRAQTVGWLDDEIAFSNDGCPMAFIRDGIVYAAGDGRYLGQSDEGVFRDRLGCIVGFIQGTRWFTALTVRPDARPVPSIQSRALPGRAHLPADPLGRAEPLLNESSLDWEQFVLGCEADWPWKTRL